MKVSEIPGSPDGAVGALLPVGLFAGQTASICVMRTEGFDGNGSTVTKIPPDREAMRPQESRLEGKSRVDRSSWF